MLCEGTALLISADAKVFRHRAEALIQHEVGTHLVTQVNGSAQPVKTMGTGLAGYDETQEGLAVLAEITVGGLTSFRLRQLAARVVTAHTMLNGASFAEAHAELVDADLPAGTAFSTVMRIYRAGGFMKDAIYLRGLLDLLHHVRVGGSLDLFYLGSRWRRIARPRRLARYRLRAQPQRGSRHPRTPPPACGGSPFRDSVGSGRRLIAEQRGQLADMTGERLFSSRDVATRDQR